MWRTHNNCWEVCAIRKFGVRCNRCFSYLDGSHLSYPWFAVHERTKTFVVLQSQTVLDTTQRRLIYRWISHDNLLLFMNSGIIATFRHSTGTLPQPTCAGVSWVFVTLPLHNLWKEKGGGHMLPELWIGWVIWSRSWFIPSFTPTEFSQLIPHK